MHLQSLFASNLCAQLNYAYIHAFKLFNDLT